MKKIMQMMMLSCRKATELIEKKTLVPLSIVERVRLYLHKSMCDACSAYEKQSLLIDKALQNNLVGAPQPENTLTEHDQTRLKERIYKMVEKEQNS